MGNAQTKMYHKISAVLPGLTTGWEEVCESTKSATHMLRERDREQFIYAIITVITQNGKHDLSEHDFRLLYSRREDDRIVARIVAQSNGVVAFKLEPKEDGKDQTTAFKAFRRHVERKLETMLQNLPGDGQVKERSAAGPSATSSSAAARSGNVPSDAPPTYGNVMKDERASSGGKKG